MCGRRHFCLHVSFQSIFLFPHQNPIMRRGRIVVKPDAMANSSESDNIKRVRDKVEDWSRPARYGTNINVLAQYVVLIRHGGDSSLYSVSE